MFFSKKKRSASDGKLVMAFGTFDFLHAGHENFLKQAKKLGSEILVVIARDNTVRSVKSRNPVNSERKRLRNLRQTGWVDKVILGNSGDKHKVILQNKPDIIALGYDQYVFTQTLQKTLIDHNLDSEIIRLDAYFPQVYKSSLIRQKIDQEKAAPVVSPLSSAIKTN